MKKLALTLVLMMLLAACGDSGATTQAPAATNAPAAATEGTVAAEPEVKEAATEVETEAVATASNVIELGTPMVIGDYEITVQSFSLTKDYEDKDVLKIVYDWKNNSDSAQAAFMVFNFKGFQNGIEVESTAFSEDIDYGIAQKEVRATYAQEGCEDGLVIDASAPIDLELTELLSFSDKDMKTLTLDPSTLE